MTERNKGCLFCKFFKMESSIYSICTHSSNLNEGEGKLKDLQKRHPLLINKDCTCDKWEGKQYEKS